MFLKLYNIVIVCYVKPFGINNIRTTFINTCDGLTSLIILLNRNGNNTCSITFSNALLGSG